MKTKRTIIRDFDAVYQAKLWLEDKKQNELIDRKNDESVDIPNAMKGILGWVTLNWTDKIRGSKISL